MLAAHEGASVSASLAGLNFEEGTSTSSTESSGATASAAATGGTTGVGQPTKTLLFSVSGESDQDMLSEEESANGVPSFVSILKAAKKALSSFSGVIDALGRKSPAKILRRLSSILDLLIRPGIPAAANDPGAQDHAVAGPNQGPVETAPLATTSLAPEAAAAGGGIDMALWDRGIDGLLQDRDPADSRSERSGAGAIGAALFLASGVVGSELKRRPPARWPSARKPRRASGAVPPDAKRPRPTF